MEFAFERRVGITGIKQPTQTGEDGTGARWEPLGYPSSGARKETRRKVEEMGQSF